MKTIKKRYLLLIISVLLSGCANNLNLSDRILKRNYTLLESELARGVYSKKQISKSMVSTFTLPRSDEQMAYLKLLLTYGADINYLNKHINKNTGANLLGEACLSSKTKPETFRFLLNSGATLIPKTVSTRLDATTPSHMSKISLHLCAELDKIVSNSDIKSFYASHTKNSTVPTRLLK